MYRVCRYLPGTSGAAYRYRHGTTCQQLGTTRHLSGLHQSTLEERGVLIDGTQLVLHNESRYLCRCSECFGATSNQPLHTDDYSDVKITEVKEVQDHFVSLLWDDGHTGIIPRSDRGAYGNGYKPTPSSKFYDLSLRKNSVQTFWESPTGEVTKRFQYEDVISSCEKTKEFLAHFMEYGLAFLSNTPHQPDDLLQILKDLKVTPYWDNMFGVLSKVSFQNDPTNQAFNNQRLAAHTDMPYYTQTPSVYFFHCVANELEGGESFWSDTFSSVQHIRETDPDMFELLTSVQIPFRQYPKEWHMAGSYPTVELMGDDIYRVRDCCFVIDTFKFIQDYSPDIRARWWQAYRYLRQLMENPARSVQVKLEGGDLVVIDNWRVQHGRNAFSVSKDGQGGRRAMEVSYIEWSHVQNRLLKMELD